MGHERHFPAQGERTPNEIDVAAGSVRYLEETRVQLESTDRQVVPQPDQKKPRTWRGIRKQPRRESYCNLRRLA